MNLSAVYEKLEEYGKVDKIRWYRDKMNIEMNNLTMENIKPSRPDPRVKSVTCGLSFSVKKDDSKIWIEIMNNDMCSVKIEDENGDADIVIEMNDGSRIVIWKNFFNATF